MLNQPYLQESAHRDEHDHSQDDASSMSHQATVSPTPQLDEEKPGPVQADEIIIPDGGTQAWLSVLGGWLVCFCTFGFASSFGVFEDYYVRLGASSSSNISWIGSLQLFFLFFMGFPAGKLFDAGYFHETTAFGILLYVFSLMMLSLANPKRYYQVLLAQGVGAGIGSGLLLVPALSVQSHHWRRLRSLAMGIVFTGSACGGIVYPIMVNQLFYNGVGFAWGVRAAAFLTLGLLVLANFCLTTRLPSARDRLRGGPEPRVLRILVDPPYMLANVGAFLGLWGVFLPYFYLQVFVRVHQLSSTLAFYTIAILNAASVVGRTLPNALADHIGVFNMLIPTTAITGALVFVMFAATTPGGVIAFAIVYGFFSGALISLIAPTLASLSSSPEEVGIRIGFGYCFCSLAMLTGTPINGALLGPEDRWAGPVVFSGVVMLAGAVFLAAARECVVRRKVTWKA